MALAAGPNFDLSGELLYGKEPSLGYPILADPITNFAPYEIKPDASGVQLKSSTQSVNSIIMISSTDRDRGVYPQPTNLTLRLPRVYSNVTSFQLIQIKLLSAFFYFRASKQNTDISIQEAGRTHVDGGVTTDAIIRSVIRQGTYDINSLITELSTQLNATPIFYDFPSGFQEFALRFATTGDFGINFNLPGDTYYDSLSDTYISNPTTSLIVSKYFQNQYAGLSSYTTNQLKIAYYYPVIKEALLDTVAAPKMNLDISGTQNLLPGETVYSRCIYSFQGINDPVILEVANLNLTTLDTYRLEHTFRYSLVNQYAVSLQSQSNRVSITTTALNKSIVTLLTNKQAQYLSEQLTNNSLTPAQYAALQQQNTLLLAVLNDMFYYLQQYLATYFGVPFNTYDISYIANPTYTIPIRDTTNAVGISSNFDPSVLSRTTPPIVTDITSQFKAGSKHYWPGYSNIDVVKRPINLDISSNHPYIVDTDTFDTTRPYVDLSSGMLYANQLLRFADIVVPLDAAEYTIFRFKSPVRQTLQIETLPRPTKYRYLAYNAANYDQEKQDLFDNSYCYVNTLPSNLDWILNERLLTIQDIPGFSTIQTTSNFGISYADSRALWGANSIFSYLGNTVSLHGFTAPSPTSSPGSYRFPLSITIAAASASNFTTPMNMYIYHDRAALLADLSSNRLESAFNYKALISTTTSISSTTATLDVYGGQTYYILSRSYDEISATQNYRVIPWFPSGPAYSTLTSTLVGFNPLADPTTPAALLNTNYATVVDPAWIRLPTSSNLIPATKADPLFQPLTYSTVAIGYDVNSVSTDATSYFGFEPGSFGTKSEASLRIDPVNGYIFQKSSPYNPSTQTYFYSTSVNTILAPGGSQVYAISTVTARQTEIVHPYYTNYISNSENQAPMLSGQIIASAYAKPYTSSITTTPIGGYNYGGSNSALQFGDGVMGISFVPQQGVWDIQRMMFASAYKTTDPAIDTNRQIKYLGAFLTSHLPTYASNLQLTSSIAVLSTSKVTTYTGSNLNFGFGEGGGTFYEFTRDTSFGTGSNHYIYGYSQIRRQFNTDSNSIYTLVPFNASGDILPYQGLLGSLVPYPLINEPLVDVSDSYFDGHRAPNENNILIPRPTAGPHPSGGPPDGYDETQAKYELSMPLGTTVTHYLEPYPFVKNPLAMQQWPLLPTTANAVFDVTGYMLVFDTVFRVYSYESGTNRVFTEAYQITVDQVVPVGEIAAYIGMAANEDVFVFASYSADNRLILRTMEPATGEIVDEISYLSPFRFDQVQLTNMTYNNAGGFTLSIKNGATPIAWCQATRTSAATTVTLTRPDPTVDRFITRQAPKNAVGQFYVYPADVNGNVQTYVYVDPTGVGAIGPIYTVTTGGLPTKFTEFVLDAGPYREPIVSSEPFKDILFFLRAGSRSIFEVLQVVGTTAILTGTSYEFPAPPERFYPGALGSKWALCAGRFYGNRNDSVDAPKTISAAWQIFYPTQRIAFTKIANNFTFMRDLSRLEYPEYPHTAIAVYDSLAALEGDIGDLSNSSGGRWGLETSANIAAADFGFSGEIFNASIFSVQLDPTTPSNPYYYAAIRNYTPTEKSQVILRCSLNNRYDFGYVKLTDLSGEVAIAASSSNLFSPEYYSRLLGFNSNFTFASKTFGANIIQGYNGSNLTNVTGFGDFYNRFTTLYNTYNLQVQLVQSINSNVTSNINAFIQTDLQYILPATALYRQRFTDPLTFSILWKSALSPEYAKLEEQWGLGWNLGFEKVDTPYSTVQISPSFFKILDDYINLRLNPEYDMNRVDSGAKENLALTQETTGSTKAFHAKLLLAPFGSYAQTLISNPVSFMPPLGRMDKLTFQWLDATETQIDNSDCEWNVVVQIVEKKEIVEIPKAALVYQGHH